MSGYKGLGAKTTTATTTIQKNGAELRICVSKCRGGRPRLPVPNSPYGLCGREATLNLNLRWRLPSNRRVARGEKAPSTRRTCSFVQCCFTPTETLRTIRDGVPRTATSTFTQVLSFSRTGVYRSGFLSH